MHHGTKRIERFNRTRNLVEFKLGDMVLIRNNPAGERIDNIVKKCFRLYEDVIYNRILCKAE